MDSRILDPPHAQFGGSLGGMVGFPYHLSHHHVYELTGHQLQSASAVPFSIDGLLNGSCTASVGNSNPLLSSGCGMNGDNQHYKLTGKPCYSARYKMNLSSRLHQEKKRNKGRIQVLPLGGVFKGQDKPHAYIDRGVILRLSHFISITESRRCTGAKQCSCQSVNTRARKCPCSHFKVLPLNSDLTDATDLIEAARRHGV